MLPQSPFPGAPPPASLIKQALRVDLAGEKGAQTIYKGQIWALGPHHLVVPLIQEMADQETLHAKAFEALLKTYHARPSLLMPLWECMGFGVGVLTGWLGGPAVMACTAAVEEVINTHYKSQIDTLADHAPELISFLNRCREEEIAHMETGLTHGAQEAPFSQTLQALIRWGTRCAVAIAKKI